MSFLGRREPTAWPAVTFNYAVGVIGLLVLALATVHRFGDGPGSAPLNLELPFAFLALFILARWLRFEVPSQVANITASLIVPVQIAAILLLGPVTTAWLALPAFLVEVIRERPLRGLTGTRLRAMLGIIAFNLGMEALITLAAGATWLVLRPGPVLEASADSLGAVVATFVVFKGVNELLMIAGHWLRGVRVREYLDGARTSVVIETLTLPLAILLVLIRVQLDWPAFYFFVFALLLAAVVMQRLTRTRHDLERRMRDIQAVSEVGRAISADIELDSLLETIHARCSDVLPSTHFYIALYNAEQQSLSIALEVIEGQRQEAHELPLGEGLTSHVIQSRKALLVRDLLAERERLPAAPLILDDQPNRTWLGVPLLARGEVVGAIVLQAQTADAYDEDDLRVLDAVASQAAISVKNARLHQEALNALLIEAENRELKALNAKKSDFVNMVSHQFRTPLTTVIGYANLLLERAKKSEGGEVRDLERHLGTVHSESRRLAQMVEELLNLSRIRAGNFPLTLQDFDMRAVMRETVAAHELLAEERDLTVRIEDDDAGALEACGDSNFIRQVLGNLVANALKYAPTGSTVTLRAAAEAGEVQVEVEDEGPGVPEQALERIFDEFYRAEGETLDKPGTGLGLSICKGILEAHGSRCWAERRGGGTAFCFRLPQAGSEAAAALSARDASTR